MVSPEAPISPETAKEAALQRLKGPLLPTFFSVWTLSNWQIFVVLFSTASGDPNTPEAFAKIALIKKLWAETNELQRFWLPLLLTVIAIFIFPVLHALYGGIVYRIQTIERKMNAREKRDFEWWLATEQHYDYLVVNFAKYFSSKSISISALTRDLAKSTETILARDPHNSQLRDIARQSRDIVGYANDLSVHANQLSSAIKVPAIDALESYIASFKTHKKSLPLSALGRFRIAAQVIMSGLRYVFTGNFTLPKADES